MPLNGSEMACIVFYTVSNEFIWISIKIEYRSNKRILEVYDIND